MDSLVDNAEFYGVDPEGPSPFENSGNNVVVLVEHECDLELIREIVLDRLNTCLTQMGVFCDGQRIYIRTDFWGMN